MVLWPVILQNTMVDTVFPRLETLIRPLPHYGRQSYIAFDGREAIEKGIWPMQVQTVMVE